MADRTPDTTAMAAAMFRAFHAREDRLRDWDATPADDAGIEAGRNTWLMLAGVAAGVPSVEERAAEEAKAQAVATKAEAAATKTEAAAETERRAEQRAAGAAMAQSQMQAKPAAPVATPSTPVPPRVA